MIYRKNGRIRMKCPDCETETKINAEIPIGKSVFLDAECSECKMQFDLELRATVKKKANGRKRNEKAQIKNS